MSKLDVANLQANVLISNIINLSSANLTINSTALPIINSIVFVGPNSVNVGSFIVNTAVSVPSITINGSSYTNIAMSSETVNVQIFTTTGANTWIKPSWASNGSELVIVHMWGGGGYGDSGTGSGGGGGAFVYGIYMANQLSNTVSLYVGEGGVPGVGANNTQFNNTLIAYSGAAALFGNSGGGGGWFYNGSGNLGGDPLGGNDIFADSTFGGGCGANSTVSSGSSIYGGGGGGYQTTKPAGNSIFGGAGGGGSVAGVSIYGGNGGNSSVSPTAPGGGGGSGTYRNGARGEVRVYTLRKIA